MSDIKLSDNNVVVDGQFDDAYESSDDFSKSDKSREDSDDQDESAEDEGDQLDFMEWNQNKNMTSQYLKFAGKISVGTNPQCSKSKQSLLKMGQDKIYLGFYSGASFRKTDNYSEQSKDKADRATLEKALNRGTVMVLYKMLNKIYTGIDGCVSTGKEANVYHATALQGHSLAVKVFKTVAAEFRNRAKYMEGEYRFKFNTCTKNLSKLVPKWVEKEFRNLHRIHKAGLPSPEPICMNKNVLVMTFIGTDGRPAPKLKDVLMSVDEAVCMYVRCVRMMRRMFQTCKLVHADLSEFNMLVHEGILYLIDVSQSLEMDNPSALQFLHADITNVTTFFRKQQVNTMNHQQLKSFIMTEELECGEEEKEEEEYVRKLMHQAVVGTYHERDDRLQEETQEDKIMNPFFPSPPREVADSDSDDSDEKSGASDHEVVQEAGESTDEKTGIFIRDKRESLEDKKARKKVIKELQRENRTHKIPKADKKRRIKITKGKK